MLASGIGKKFSTGFVLTCSTILLVGCGEKMTNTATPEKLQEILSGDTGKQSREEVQQTYDEIVTKSASASEIRAQFDATETASAGPVDLYGVVDSALMRNGSIGEAAQQITRADAQNLNAILGYTPQLAVTANYNNFQQEVISSDNEVFEGGTAEFPVSSYGITMRQPIVDFERFYAIKRSGAGQTAAAVNYTKTVNEVIFQTIDTYLTAFQSQQRIKNLQTQSGLLSQQKSAEASLAYTGLSTGPAADAINVEIGGINSEISQERAKYQRALSELSRLSGVPITAVTNPNISPDMGSMGSVDDAISTALANNPTLFYSQIRGIENFYRDRGALAADFAPRIDFVASYAMEDREGSLFGGASQTATTSYGAELVIPLFNAEGEGYSNLLTRVDFKDSVRETEITKRQIMTDVGATYERVNQLRQALGQSNASYSASNRVVSNEQQLANTGYSADSLVLAAQTQSAAAKANVDFLNIEYLRAWVYLQYLTGRNLTEFIS